MLYTKINSKWIEVINISAKTIELLEETIKKLHDMDLAPEAEATKGKKIKK